MVLVFVILIVIASIILGLIVLIQNPKGGGLSSTFGGVGNQLMGVKQTTDVLEKGTWLFASIIAVLCIISPMFIGKSAADSSTEQYYDASGNPAPKPATPNNTVPLSNPTPQTTTPPVTK